MNEGGITAKSYIEFMGAIMSSIIWCTKLQMPTYLRNALNYDFYKYTYIFVWPQCIFNFVALRAKSYR